MHDCSEGGLAVAAAEMAFVGGLGMGDDALITIVVTPNVVGTITNTATVTGDGVDPVAGNNTATQDTLVTPAIFDIYLPLIMKG